MDDFERDLKKRMENKEFREGYNELEAEYTVIQALIDARKGINMTQKQLAALTGVDQADISKLERGVVNPSLKTLQRIADGMGMKLRLSFEPKPQSI